MSRHSRELAQLADDLAAEQARHAEVIRKLTQPDAPPVEPDDDRYWRNPDNIMAESEQDHDPFEIVPGERILASFDDVSQRTEIVREGERVCLQCLGPIAGYKPYPASGPAWCRACEATR